MEGVKFPNRSATTYRASCSVPGCKTNARKNLAISLHKFPKPNEGKVNVTNYFGNVIQIDRLKAWQIAVKINQVSNDKRVCSMHFKKEDYYMPDSPAQKRRLRNLTVPSQHLPTTDQHESERRLKKRLKIMEEKEKYLFVDVSDPLISDTSHHENEFLPEEEEEPAQKRNEDTVICDSFSQSEVKNETENQETSDNIIVELESLIKVEKEKFY